MDILKPGQRPVVIQQKVIKPGITRLQFKNFEDMGDYYQSRMDEFEARGVRMVTIGITMFIFETPQKENV